MIKVRLAWILKQQYKIDKLSQLSIIWISIQSFGQSEPTPHISRFHDYIQSAGL